LLDALLDACSPGTRLCVAIDLTLPSESIAMRRVAEWRAGRRPIGRRPAVFLLQA
jgi:16S rRNA (cytidine1402-2'-O)-methyltransferase